MDPDIQKYSRKASYHDYTIDLNKVYYQRIMEDVRRPRAQLLRHLALRGSPEGAVLDLHAARDALPEAPAVLRAPQHQDARALAGRHRQPDLHDQTRQSRRAVSEGAADRLVEDGIARVYGKTPRSS